MKIVVMVGIASAFLLVSFAGPASAQQSMISVRKDAMEKVTFYRSPLRYQYVDDGPIISDHRTPPQAAQMLQLPIAPLPEGAMMQPGSIPPGGIPIPGNGVYRSSSPMITGLPSLPRVGFDTNIPARSPVVARNLPGGASTNLLGRLYKPQQQSGARAQSARPMAIAAQHEPAVATYKDNGGGSATQTGWMRVTTQVSAKIKPGDLLRK